VVVSVDGGIGVACAANAAALTMLVAPFEGTGMVEYCCLIAASSC